ncbi:MAG TPA: AMP-binding protein [Caulobacteraceae bacterium]|nr:AMP-binding protein [Caulobacteraceae bacterium]
MTGNLYSLLASRFPDDRRRPAFILPDGHQIDYGALETGVGRVAALLKAKGVAPGDRIACQTPKSTAAIMLYLASLKIGAIFLPLNTAYTAAEVDYFLSDAEPALFVQDAEGLAREAESLTPSADVHNTASSDLAALIYTSGTTGRSKGAMISHGALADNGLVLHKAWGFSPADVLLHALPIFHIHGLFVALHTALLSGAPMLWLDKFDEDQMLAALARATVMMGVPTFYTRLLAHPRFTREAARNVRLFVSGSAPLLESTFDAFEQRIGVRILERYGMSEAQMITSNPLAGDRLAGSVGFPLPGVDLRIADDTGTGGVEIKGPSLFSGYWRNPEKTRDAFTEDGFFITGDIGRLDEDGRLWLSGRSGDLIISGGLNVYPKEIELVLDELDGVVESAVIGCPHPDFGEAVVAVIVGGGEAEAMIAAVRQRLAAFKTPKRVVFVERLPRNAMGKVEKAALRKRYADLFQ